MAVFVTVLTVLVTVLTDGVGDGANYVASALVLGHAGCGAVRLHGAAGSNAVRHVKRAANRAAPHAVRHLPVSLEDGQRQTCSFKEHTDEALHISLII